MRRLLAVLVLLVAACGSATPVAPAEAIDHVPLGRAFVLASDRAHLWMTDHHDLATYDVAEQRWSKSALPTQGEAIDQLAAAPVDDGLVVLLASCDGPCERMRENLAGIEALFVADGTVRSLGPLPKGLRHYAQIDVLAAGGQRARFRTSARGTTWIVDASSAGATARTSDLDTRIACTTATGVAAIEQVPLGSPGSVDPPPPPPGSSGLEVHVALRVSTGPDLDHLSAVAVPEGVRQVLHDWWTFGGACLPDGLALLQQHGAWELHGTEWHQAPATLASGIPYLAAVSLVALPDGTIIAAGLLERDPSGGWTDHDPYDQVAVLGDTVVHHRIDP